jgi:hypothetical protein
VPTVQNQATLDPYPDVRRTSRPSVFSIWIPAVTEDRRVLGAGVLVESGRAGSTGYSPSCARGPRGP